MQQFTVPQFIDVEDKILGPITVRQFSILLVAFMIIAILYKFFDFSFFAVFGTITFVIAMVFAFLKVHGRPFHFFILSFLQTLARAKLRVWNNRSVPLPPEEHIEIEKTIKPVPVDERERSLSRLTELSLIVDTQGAFKPGARNGQIKVLDEADKGFV